MLFAKSKARLNSKINAEHRWTKDNSMPDCPRRKAAFPPPPVKPRSAKQKCMIIILVEDCYADMKKE